MASADDTAQLWRAYRRTGDNATRERLITTYAPLVDEVAEQLRPRLRLHDKDDLVSYGLLGLLQAIERFEPDADGEFEPYAAQRIERAIMGEVATAQPPNTRSRASRRALGALFTFLTVLFALIAVAAYVARVWAIVFAAAVLAFWLAGMALRGFRAR